MYKAVFACQRERSRNKLQWLHSLIKDQGNKTFDTKGVHLLQYLKCSKQQNSTKAIVKEQLETWRQTVQHFQCHYVGRLLQEDMHIPCKTRKMCIQVQLRYITSPNGHREGTTQKLYKYNTMFRHPYQRVISPGRRKLIAASTLDKVFSDMYDNSSWWQMHCLLCRFHLIPHWHTPGHMWVSQCSRVHKLIPPKDFESRIGQAVHEIRIKHPKWQICIIGE